MDDFTSKDRQQIKNHGLSLEKVQRHLQTFNEGIPHVALVEPATLENGIWRLTLGELELYCEKYDDQNLALMKFVPASGAATRMFKSLQSFQNDLQGFQNDLQGFQNDLQGFQNDLQGFQNDLQGFQNLVGLNDLLRTPKYTDIPLFFEHLPEFAFYGKLLSETKNQHPRFEDFSEDQKKYSLLQVMLDKTQLNFSKKPKGLVPFHKYPKKISTAFEEHFVEALAYCTKKHHSRLHFTISENYLKEFQKESERIQEKFKKEHGTEFDVSFSFQSKSTDTIATDLENRPFRDEDGMLVFRPSGHGALLKNLNEIDADLIFIKNIDNVSVERNLPLVSFYKKALAGILLEIQSQAFRFLEQLDQADIDLHDIENQEGMENIKSIGISNALLQQAKSFLKEKLNVVQEPKTISELKNLLNRPIRVCGMVKNTGAPGGGPFWIKGPTDEVSLQIVETAQVDQENPQQRKILQNATHFNPVDLVCGVKNYRGKKFDLFEFSNPKRGFITKKSTNGLNLKALERPGLWNGAMEFWNTVFVEVPQETFNAVKTVMDLLKPLHQPDK